MTFFSYSCASFGWPVIGPAMSTSFLGLSAARLKKEQKQNSKANGNRSGKNLRRLIGDGESVDDPHQETRPRIDERQSLRGESFPYLFRSVLPASCRHNGTG